MRRMGALLAGGLFLVSGLSWASAGTSGSDGQWIFIPAANVSTALSRPDGPVVLIQSCEASTQGLRVVGRVDPAFEPGPILVSGGDPSSPGIRVGAAEAANARLLSDAVVGDFIVVLPWAGKRSDFAVAASESGEAPWGHGPVTNCPTGVSTEVGTPATLADRGAR